MCFSLRATALLSLLWKAPVRGVSVQKSPEEQQKELERKGWREKMGWAAVGACGNWKQPGEKWKKSKWKRREWMQSFPDCFPCQTPSTSRFSKRCLVSKRPFVILAPPYVLSALPCSSHTASSLPLMCLSPELEHEWQKQGLSHSLKKTHPQLLAQMHRKCLSTHLPNNMSLKNVEGINKWILARTILGQLWDLKPIYTTTNSNKILL